MIDLDCDICLHGEDDSDSVDNYEAGIVTAAETRSCAECRRAIAPGTAHEWATFQFEGEQDERFTCTVCVEIRDAFYCNGGWSFGTVWEDIEDNLFDNLTTGCLAKLTTPEAKQYLIERWMRWMGLR